MANLNKVDWFLALLVASGKSCRMAEKFIQGHQRWSGCGLTEKGSTIIDGSRFRETYFFSAGKKSKHADHRETMNTFKK